MFVKTYQFMNIEPTGFQIELFQKPYIIQKTNVQLDDKSARFREFKRLLSIRV